MKNKLLVLFLTSFITFSFPAFAENININTASVEELANNLNGIGKKKAEAIVKYRKENGNFKSTEDIQSVKGIGKGIFSKIKTDITVSSSMKSKPPTKSVKVELNKDKKENIKTAPAVKNTSTQQKITETTTTAQ